MATAPVGPLIPEEAKKKGGLDFRAYLDLKIGIHRELLKHVDLEKVATQCDDGTRRLTHITEITGMEGDIVLMQDVFVFEKQGVSSDGRTLGTFTATGIRPRFEEKLRASGISLPVNFFDPSVKYQDRQR